MESISQVLKSQIFKNMNLTSPCIEAHQDACEDLRPKFIKDYGISIQIPAYYHYDAKFFPGDPDFVVTMGFHVIQDK